MPRSAREYLPLVILMAEATKRATKTDRPQPQHWRQDARGDFFLALGSGGMYAVRLAPRRFEDEMYAPLPGVEVVFPDARYVVADSDFGRRPRQKEGRVTLTRV